MLILNSEQAKAIDLIAASSEGIASIDLMERAASRLTAHLLQICPLSQGKRYLIFCGPGNNGGDGLAMARMLYNAGADVSCFALKCFPRYSPDFQANCERLRHSGILSGINSEPEFPAISRGDVVVDAIFGSGLSRPPQGLAARLIRHINSSNATVVAIDIPSGLDAQSIPEPGSDSVLAATHTLTIQSPFLSMMMPECDQYVGSLSIVDIGIEKYYDSAISQYHYFTISEACQIMRPRRKFSHKGTYGHALIMAGSLGKGGAAVLCAKACHRAGAGLVTARIPSQLTDIMQIASPETMVYPDPSADCLKSQPDTGIYSAIAIGPGIGTSQRTASMLRDMLASCSKPMVIDADALNIIASNPGMLDIIPKNSVITPHPKEFERLFGKSENSLSSLNTAAQAAQRLGIVIVLKGANTRVCAPDGNVYFNSTGNPSMATAGSGDTLTGIVAALLAQKYTPVSAALLGVLAHGLAADLAGARAGLLASDIISRLPEAWNLISEKR